MAVSYVQSANPIWYIADLVGRPAGGAMLYSYKSSNKIIPKPIFQDNGANAFPNPIPFDQNGQIGLPFYFMDDEPYYLEVYDADGNMIWKLDNFVPVGAGGGGGGSTTIYQSLKNYVGNNVHFRHIETVGSAITTIPSGTVLAPGNHEGFSSPDTTIFKQGGAAFDEITFPEFPLDQNPFGGDVTPEAYLKYHCITPGVETYKAIRYPINLHVNSFENQPISVSFWAIGLQGTQTIQVNIRQDFGQGGGAVSAAIVTAIGAPKALTTGTWIKYFVTGTVPAVPPGTILGTCGDDAVYLELALPNNAVSEIGLSKASLYIGTLLSQPGADFETYDQIDTIINSPRTGDIRSSYQLSAPLGWIPLNDGTIGNVIGASSSNATTRANPDTWSLYKLLWGNPYCPIVGASLGSAVADFNGLLPLTLPPTLGRALAAAGTGSGIPAHPLGQPLGADTHVITASEVPPLPTSSPTFVITNTNGSANFDSGSNPSDVVSLTINPNSPNTAMSILQPTTYQNVFIKL